MTGFRWFQIFSGWFQVVSAGFRWFQLLSHGFRWFQLVPRFSKYDLCYRFGLELVITGRDVMH